MPGKGRRGKSGRAWTLATSTRSNLSQLACDYARRKCLSARVQRVPTRRCDGCFAIADVATNSAAGNVYGSRRFAATRLQPRSLIVTSGVD